MDISEGTTTDDLWTPYKELVSVVEGYLTTEGAGAPYAVHTFESVLRRHKQTFLALFKNPAKNPASREEIKRGITEGVTLPSVGRTLLSKELVDEAIIISDMYNVNEYLALELLHTAQRQSPRHPGLARGLVAILLYYDGRRALVHALKEIVMARDGVCWSIGSREEIVSYVTRYVETLVSDGLLGGVLDALRRFVPDAELALLQANRALPPHRYYSRLLATMDTTRKMLAGVVFSASAQRGLNRDIILRLISEQTTAPSLGATGALDEISLALQMSLLYALDLSVLHKREDGEELAKKLPLIQDPDLISVLLDELSPSQGSQGPENPEKTTGVRALCQLSLGLALAALKRAPQSLLRGGEGGELKVELLDQDEVLVDAAIDGKVFEYLDESILSTDFVGKEEYYQRRIHILITDFIVLMHSKLMEMRVKADEAARAVQMYASEGLAPPAAAAGARTRLDALLRCVEKLYAADPLRLRLRDDYWEACNTHAHAHRGGGRAATLYKFVRLSGELVCAALVPAYLRALAALAVPRHTWALLARRDALSAHHALTALARYYCNLRSDPSPFTEPRHAASLGASALAHRPGKLLVRQEEVEAMIAALRLIAGVARVDPAACASICENLQWDAVNVMFGLMGCHIPLQLKAELCTTLAALGGTSGTAPRVWAALEGARLVTVDPDKRPLTAELCEVECRMEQYPLSLAFLSLLEALCGAAPLPRALGAGARVPGLDPYLQHVLHQLALPAPHRAYAKPHQKWQMLSQCFRLFARWLEQYEVSPGDFPPAQGAADAAPPPGFRLAMHLHSRSDLLRLVFAALEETLVLLDQQPPPPGKEFVEESLVSVLQILERALALERALVTAAAEANRSVLIVGLSKLMLVPEEGSSACRMVAWCRAVSPAAAVPRAAAAAVALLRRALQPAAAARRLLAAVTHRAAAPNHIRHGFVECLEAEEWGAEGAEGAVRAAKEGVVLLLLQLLPTAPPNLAHFLLGFQLDEDVSRSALNEPGAAGFPRTCLHSILDILDQFIAGQGDSVREADNLIESCYRLVYWLCARPSTSAPVLRYLRSRDYFLTRHVKRTINLKTASAVSVSAASWVLRACACEAGAAAAARHHAALATLLTALTRSARHASVSMPQYTAAAARHHAALATLLTALTRSARHASEWEFCLLRRTLESLPVAVEEVPEPRWELFHAHQLRQAIASCDIPTGAGGKRVSVSRMHALLARELAALHATAPQRNLVSTEIQKVLDYVMEVNRQRNLAATLTHYYDSWRQLTEILFCVASHDILNLEARKNLLLNILQDLLSKIPPAEVLPQLGNLASGTVLLLLVNLRHCYILQKRETNLKSTEFESTFFGPSSHIMQTNSLTLKFILHKILSWILVSGGCTQKMRVNLYGALLNFLNIVNLKPSAAEPEEETNTTYVSRLDSSKARPSKEESSLKSMVVDVINDFGENLCAIVCGDCIGAGHDVCRMVALACLETLVEINPRTDWMNTLTNQGYLRSLIDSLLQDDQELKEALEPQPRSLRALYVYASRMALLLKLAAARRGAETALAQGALARLADSRALRLHPDVHASHAHGRDSDFLPTVANRFSQILVPALALCDALLTTLGTENHSCVLHVTHLLLSHLECIDMVLRAAHPNSPASLLTEVEAVTSVVSRASNREVFGLACADTALQHAAPGLRRVRSLMLALLARFHCPPDEPGAVYFKIVCNLVWYARNTLSPETGGAGVALEAGAGAGEGEAPPLGACVALLARLVRLAHKHDKLLATARHRLHALPTMTLDDIKKLLPAESSELSPVEARAAAVTLLRAGAAARRRELQRCTLALEADLGLLWAHVRRYLRAVPPAPVHPGEALTTASAIRGAAGDDLPELRKELIALFNDRFTEELLDTAKNQPPAQRGYLEVLVKDIKSMIQFSPL